MRAIFFKFIPDIGDCRFPNIQPVYCIIEQKRWMRSQPIYIMQRGSWGNDGVLKSVYRHAMTGNAKEMNQKANDYFSTMQHKMQQKNNP